MWGAAMSSVFSAVMIQASYYGIVLVLTLFFVGAFQRGFFTTYFKVRTSFGKYVMVKIRSPLRDYFKKGWVEEGFLIYEIRRTWKEKDIIRLNIPQKGPSPFYKCMSVNWIDVDDEKHAICQTDYSVASGYDAIKNNNLHQRALMRPSITTGYEKLMLFLLAILIIAVLVDCVIGWSAYKQIALLRQDIPGIIQGMRGTVVGGPII
jgi:hypothetical protein